ncbi:MAG: type II toxin-antitoxin system RatA family toxin [Rickettsiales bacterium]|nr:type II toxin-antitoxin system RatA family toxin [Rickettsiales bacterium]
MPSLTQNKTLPYSAQQMQSLVMDIEKYPEFLPWCKQAKIVERISDDNLRADLLINFKNFFEKYRSDVKHGRGPNGSHFIDVVAIEGPFKKLVNQWKFRDLEDGNCEVEFFIEFEFSSIFLTKMLGMIFEKATEKMMAAFEERAQEMFKK